MSAYSVFAVKIIPNHFKQFSNPPGHNIRINLNKILSDRNTLIVNKNYAEFIQLPKKNETSKSRFTDTQLEKLRQSIESVSYTHLTLPTT